MPPSATQTLRVGVIGLGVGHQHVLGYRRLPGCEVVAVCDLSAEKLAAERASDAHVTTTSAARDIIESPDIDVVSIASHDDAHFDQVMAALAAGKHVFAEKPLCQSIDQLRQIKQAWQRHGGRIKLRTNVVLRGAPLYRWLREQVRSGVLGELYAFDGDYLYGRLSKITEGWRGNVPDYSVIAGGGIHLIDLMLWITGQRPQSVMAWGNRICTQGTRFRYNDFVAATMQFPSGLIGRITANFGCVHGHQHVMRIFGKNATFLYDDCGPRWQSHRDPAPAANPIDRAPLPAGKDALIGDFMAAVRDDVDLAEEFQAELDAVSICMACDEAIRIGNCQDIEYV